MTSTLPQRMQAFYERLDAEQSAALSELPALYTDDIQFVSPIEQRIGLSAFADSWRKAFETYKAFTFTDFKVIGDDAAFALFYTMTIDLGIGRPMPTPTATLFICREGKVYYQYDYWDTVAGLAQIVPPLRTAYDWAVALFLGGGRPVQIDPGIHVPLPGEDGLYHPASEAEIASIVRKTYDLGGKVRVVGSGHSVWEAIVPEGFDPKADTNERLLVLDKYRRVLSFRDDPEHPGCALVEVEAGIHLGDSPRHPLANPISTDAEFDATVTNVTFDATWAESLNVQLQRRGFALPDLGGITHQAVGGFLSTGSAGGTCKWSFLDAVVAFRVVDGTGAVRVLTKDGPGKEDFACIGAGLGLQGIVSTVTLRAVPTYDVVGRETVAETATHPDLDFYGPGDERPSLAKFLVETDYARLMWWPQRHFDRLVVWQATRTAPTHGFEPRPYAEVGRFPVVKQSAASLLYTVLGNLDDPDSIAQQLERLRATGHDVVAAFRALAEAIRTAPPPDPSLPLVPQDEHPFLSALAGRILGDRHPAITLDASWVKVVQVLTTMIDTLVAGALGSELLAPLVKLLRWAAPHVIDRILSPFVALSSSGGPSVQTFQDVWYLGLPMDNGMDDLLMPTYFTEIWIPFSEDGHEVIEAVTRLRRLFDADGTAEGCYAATGPFSIELYATKGGTAFHLDPAYGDKNIFRVDVFWFGMNDGDPRDAFYPRFWEALDGLDYRLHWGKYLPRPDQMAPSRLTSRFPGFEAWTSRRTANDPKDVFLTAYWKRQLGL